MITNHKIKSRQAHTGVTPFICMYSTFAPQLCRTAVMKRTVLKNENSFPQSALSLEHQYWHPYGFTRKRQGEAEKLQEKQEKTHLDLASKYAVFPLGVCYDDRTDSTLFVTLI